MLALGAIVFLVRAKVQREWPFAKNEATADERR
jgi:hypothetical protein